MLVLALDTTTPAGSVALWRDGRLLGLRETDPSVSYGQQLPWALTSLLEACGADLHDVDVFGVASGPGSMTGLRVGIATVQGLALALDRPVVPVSALEALAASVVSRTGVLPGARIGALTNARRGEVFSALYVATEGLLQEVDPPAVGVADTVCERWHPLVSRHPATFVGDGVPLIRTTLERWFGSSASGVDAGPLAGVVAELAADRFTHGRAISPHAIQPLYVRRTDAEVARDRQQAKTDGGVARQGTS